MEEIAAIEVYRGAGEAVDQLTGERDHIGTGGRAKRRNVKQRQMPRALHVIQIADEHLRYRLPSRGWFPAGTTRLPERMPSGDEASIEEASGPEGADGGGKDKQSPGRQFQQHEAPEALGPALNGPYGLLFANH